MSFFSKRVFSGHLTRFTKVIGINAYLTRLASTSTSTVGILGLHDLGGKAHETDFPPISSENIINSLLTNKLDKTRRNLAYWERKIDALEQLMLSKKLCNLDEFRRAIESMPHKSYLNASYYERWLYSITTLAIEKSYFNNNDLYKKIQSKLTSNISQNNDKSIHPKYSIGDKVRVRYDSETIQLKYNIQWRQSHIRTPGYSHNKYGIIQRYCGDFTNPELSSFGINESNQVVMPLYRVRFDHKELWNNNDDNNNIDDSIDIEILEHWLERVPDQEFNDHHHSHEHQHGHGHGHEHKHQKRDDIENNALDKEPRLSGYQILLDSVLDLLNENNIISNDEIRKRIEIIDKTEDLNIGSDITIKAWKDDNFRKEILDLEKSNEIIENTFKELNLSLGPTKMCFVENTSNIHNVIVCTLCSCYPRKLLGIPPDWYKSIKYRSLCVENPRKLLNDEFGLNLSKDITLRVHDSTNELRYMVIPHLPSQIPNWESLSDQQLKEQLTRDMLIGVAR